MMNIIKMSGLFLFLYTGQFLYGQTNKEKAFSKGQQAIELMDNGRVDESIKLLEEAQKLDPDRLDYPYELAYAHYLKEDYKGAIKILKKIINHKDVTDRVFQLLGNSYDVKGKCKKAFKVYDAGLKKFPDSGIIYLEKGNVYWGKKEYVKALPFYEKGIEVDPTFPSNYYRAARIYCATTEEVWGLIYGEIFMNLESNSNRTYEISKLLFDTYKSEIRINKDSTSIDFCNIVINAEDVNDKEKIKFPFCMVFGQAFILAINDVDKIDINSLDKIRTGFVKNYFQQGHNKTHPNLLFDYQDKLLKAGHLEAYNHWVLMKGDEEGFVQWKSANQVKWDEFVKWFADNGLKVDNMHRFYSGQYNTIIEEK
ncbi:MAG: tetratricopeptide repeat protein [Bacteroidetes bacterium]|nr:tetratricopeptide repeat protein [Bacteroidota bacterium]